MRMRISAVAFLGLALTACSDGASTAAPEPSPTSCGFLCGSGSAGNVPDKVPGPLDGSGGSGGVLPDPPSDGPVLGRCYTSDPERFCKDGTLPGSPQPRPLPDGTRAA